MQFRCRHFSQEVTMPSIFKPLIVSAALALAGFSAFAQMHHPEGGMQGMRANPEKMHAMVAKHMTELKAKLKITAEQDGAWTAFTAAMKPADHKEMKRPDPAEMAKLSTPERMDAMRKFHNGHQTEMNAAMDKRHEAVKAFYGTLTAEQKKVFDAEHSRVEGRMHKRMEHRKAP
jgi:protein CpxP